MSFNFKVPPFNDINVRKAVIAGMDRNALRLTRGGEVIGPIMQHQIRPGCPASTRPAARTRRRGRLAAEPERSKTVSAKYFKAAGMYQRQVRGQRQDPRRRRRLRASAAVRPRSRRRSCRTWGST
jgi:peptide/nickel transport system substrate-binding protein